jgi:hypothetical protein
MSSATSTFYPKNIVKHSVSIIHLLNFQFLNTICVHCLYCVGDDTLLAIQTRGGPDRHTVSSWVQIMEFKHIHSGNYTCLGTNKVDTVVASAVLDIRKMT